VAIGNLSGTMRVIEPPPPAGDEPVAAAVASRGDVARPLMPDDVIIVTGTQQARVGMPVETRPWQSASAASEAKDTTADAAATPERAEASASETTKDGP